MTTPRSTHHADPHPDAHWAYVELGDPETRRNGRITIKDWSGNALDQRVISFAASQRTALDVLSLTMGYTLTTEPTPMPILLDRRFGVGITAAATI